MSYYLRVEGKTKSLTRALEQNFLTFYQRVKGRTKILLGALVEIQNVLLATGGRTNQATNKCLDKKLKSYYLWVE